MLRAARASLMLIATCARSHAISALSMPRPEIAASTCSTVSTDAPSFDNAVRHSDQGGALTIEAASDPKVSPAPAFAAAWKRSRWTRAG